MPLRVARKAWKSARTQPVLCIGSAVFGAALAIFLSSFPQLDPPLHADEPYRGAAAGYSPEPQPSMPGSQYASDRMPLAMGPSRDMEHLDELTPEERANVAIYEDCNRSVVNINTMVATPSIFLIDIVQEGVGSGTVIDKQGHILTNFHVVEGAKEIQVTAFDGKSYQGKLVGRDPATDICVLKIDAPADTLFPTRLGDSSRLKVGQRVYAIGNPFGLERTLTTGIVSSLNRSLPARNNRTIKSIIQIDAAINPGNSGGPLMDSRGRLIGMNTAIASKNGQNTGVGFAIPVSVINRVVPELITHGKVTRPETGISRVYETERGLLIASLVPSGPAEQAGLRGFKISKQRKRQGPFAYDSQTVDRTAADMIIAVNGQPTVTADDFLSAIDAFHPGDQVTITVVRDGRETAVPIRLGAAES